MIKKKNGVDIENAVKESCEKNGIILFDQLKMVCEDEKVRQFNTLNKKSLILNCNDFNNIDNFEDIAFFDCNNDKVIDVSLYFPTNKAYIILNRVHFGKLYENNKKQIMRLFIDYLIFPDNFKYFSSAIYLNVLGFGIDDYILKEVGFFNYGQIHILCFLNTNFKKDFLKIPVDEQVKPFIFNSYKSLDSIKNHYLYNTKICLATANMALKDFKEKKYSKKLIEMKEKDVEHYKEVLSNYNYYI